MSDFNELFKKIKKNNVQPVYLLYGEAQYFIDLFKQKITKILGEEIEEEIVTYDLNEITIQDVLIDVETIPFFTNKKLIFVDNPAFLRAKQEKTPMQHDVEKLINYIENPAPYSVLVLVAPYEKLDERKRITKQLKKYVQVVHCALLKEQALRDWVLHLAKEQHITIAEDACDMLEAEFQTDLILLDQEVKKLALYVGRGGYVTKEMTMQLMSTSLNQNALQLVDAVLQKDLYRAIDIYKGLEKMKEDPIGLLALLSYQFRIIFQVKLLLRKGYPLQKIQSEIKVHPYVVKLAKERSNHYSIEALQKIIDEMTNTDTMIKTGKMDKGIAFELLLYNLSMNEQYV